MYLPDTIVVTKTAARRAGVVDDTFKNNVLYCVLFRERISPFLSNAFYCCLSFEFVSSNKALSHFQFWIIFDKNKKRYRFPHINLRVLFGGVRTRGEKMSSLRHVSSRSTASSSFKCSTSSRSRLNTGIKHAQSVAATAEINPTETTANATKKNALVEALTTTPEFSTLVSAVSRADLLDAVTSLQTGTIFAPTNEAFEDFGKGKDEPRQIFQRKIWRRF